MESPRVPSDASNPNVLEKIRIDNRFRFGVSLTAFAVAAMLRATNVLPDLRPIGMILAAYSIPYFVTGLLLDHIRVVRWIPFFLSLMDFLAITLTVAATGGPASPFFYLYPIPFLVHALYFDVPMIAFDGALSVAGYGALIAYRRPGGQHWSIEFGMGQFIFLCLIITAALLTAKRFRRKQIAVDRSVGALRTMVVFLEALDSIPPGLSPAELQHKIVEQLHKALKPLRVYSRLWVLDAGWKTLQGAGEHPALRPGSPHHLPVLACPAFALRQPFRYLQGDGEPCHSEQFNYGKHLCLPVSTEKDSFGVLFLATHGSSGWDTEELHLFGMLAQSVALTIERRTLFEQLKEKIAELNFSFEVGATALSTFIGSTQSIDETTVHILDGVLSILKVDRASLMLWNPQSKMLQTQWVRGGDFKIQSPMQLQMGEGMAGWALQCGQPYWAEYAMGDPHYVGSAQPISSLLCVPVYAMDGQPLGVINALTKENPRAFLDREITFLMAFGRQAALAIENAQLHHRNRANIDQLRELNQMKSQFLSLVSHDLRGPLTGIRGFCEILKQQAVGTLAPAQSEVVDQLERQVDLQERMVDDLLDLARMEKGQFSIHPAATDLPALLREEVEKSQMEARERRITLSYLCDGQALPPIEADGGRIRQVVWNLVHNALKFTPEDGRIRVKAEALEGRVIIGIEDTGVGLSKEVVERVFEKFFQVSPGGSRGAQGLGLGLAICKEIVLAHHGRIWAESPGLGLGTTISFSLPASQSIPAADEKAA